MISISQEFVARFIRYMLLFNLVQNYFIGLLLGACTGLKEINSCHKFHMLHSKYNRMKKLTNWILNPRKEAEEKIIKGLNNL